MARNTKMTSERVRLTNISRYDKDRDGKPLKSKFNNKPQERIVVQTEEYPGKDMSGWFDLGAFTWKAGDEMEVVITENQGWLNFRLPKRDDVIDAKLDQILAKLEGIEEDLGRRP